MSGACAHSRRLRIDTLARSVLSSRSCRPKLSVSCLYKQRVCRLRKQRFPAMPLCRPKIFFGPGSAWSRPVLPPSLRRTRWSIVAACRREEIKGGECFYRVVGKRSQARA